MWKSGLGLVCMILAVGCLDGPAGYESNNYLGAFIFASMGIILFGVQLYYGENL